MTIDIAILVAALKSRSLVFGSFQAITFQSKANTPLMDPKKNVANANNKGAGGFRVKTFAELMAYVLRTRARRAALIVSSKTNRLLCCVLFVVIIHSEKKAKAAAAAAGGGGGNSEAAAPESEAPAAAEAAPESSAPAAATSLAPPVRALRSPFATFVI